MSLFEFIERDSKHFPHGTVAYYFRGENRNYDDSSSCYPSAKPPMPRLFLPQNKAILQQEKEYYYETIQRFPDLFANDTLTLDKLARMQHYDYMTRLLDVTVKLPTAMAMLLPSRSEDQKTLENTGFIHVYRVKKSRIKYAHSDTAIILSNLVKVSGDKICLQKGRVDLDYLMHECQLERPGMYYFDRDGMTLPNIINDIQHIWCIHPNVNSPRIAIQRGEFFLYGCRDQKEVLDATFSEEDYENPNAPSYGLARIGAVAISPALKNDFLKHKVYFDLSPDRIYPDFHFHAQELEKNFKQGE